MSAISVILPRAPGTRQRESKDASREPRGGPRRRYGDRGVVLRK